MQDVVIVAWTAGNRVAKYQDCSDLAECQQHLDRIKGQWPDAFIAVAPNDAVGDWLIDPVAKSLSLDPVPVPARVPSDLEIIKDALLSNAVVTQAQLTAAKTKLTK